MSVGMMNQQLLLIMVIRHTHASNMLSNNYPITQLAHRLGHADPSITLSIYSHVVKGMELDVNNYIPSINLKQVK